MKLSDLHEQRRLARAENDYMIQLSGTTHAGLAVRILAGALAASVPRRQVSIDEYTHVEVAFSTPEGDVARPPTYASALPGWDGAAFAYVPVALLGGLLSEDLA